MLSLDWTPDDGGAPQSIDIDCAVTVTFECASEVTDHPVETGSSVADNIRTHNDTVTLEALISNQPIEMPKFGTNGASG
jgi:hypothetical protein